MRDKLLLFAASALVAAPASAGAVVPGPEAGVGLAAMLLIGTGYAYLRRRSRR